jgi:DNA polymerase/3'-5' exonuclease PolX
MNLSEAQEKAQDLVRRLSPHCERIEVAGSIRREERTIGDIEIVCIPKTKSLEDLFDLQIQEVRDPGFVVEVQKMKKIKGDVEDGRYMQRRMEDGTKVDIFTARAENWGYILAIRTGSADFSRELASAWVKRGYHGQGGMLTKRGEPIEVREERDLFELAGVPWRKPKDRRS